MEEGGSRTAGVITASQSQAAPSASTSTANGKSSTKPGMTKKAQSPTHRDGSSSSDVFVGVAAMLMGSKSKGKGKQKESSNKKSEKQNGCDDDLPLGSEAHSLSLEYATNTESKYPLPEDKRSKWHKTNSQSLLGWQSFNSDVSNQTSASSASLEQLLNDRQVDPEEMLLNLGFGGESQSLMPSLARVPERFLQHPSRAYGITSTGCSEEEIDNIPDAATQLPSTNPQSGGSAAVMAPARKRTGIWTLARTLSMLRSKTNPSRGNSSANSSGTQAHNNQIISILHPANQKYLASRGFYEKQGWPKGSFIEPEDDPMNIIKDEAESKDAALKRKIFKKTRPPRNWSICDSEENDTVSSGREWISKSVDDQSREDFVGQDDSLGRGTYFSTTTESSTDSLDTPNLETERAFQNIRKEYEKSRQIRTSSDDLFLPTRKKRLSSEVVDSEDNLGLEHDLDLLGSNIGSGNYFISPASSRQTTIEKAPTFCEKSLSVRFIDDVDDNDGIDNRDNGDTRRDGNGILDDGSKESGREDVRIVVSTSESRHLPQFGEHRNHGGKSGLTVKGTQTASSDSGSSSATAVGSTCDRLEPAHAESENILTDWNSNSNPSTKNSLHSLKLNMISSCSQTTDSDFNIVAAANQNNKDNTSNKSILFVRVNESGSANSTQDRKREDYTIIQQSPKVQLSSLPTTLNHLELMKRLQQSQGELSRMGSLQSDSSGFGDADPALEPDALKQTSLTSSHENSKILASGATVIMSKSHMETIATQTGVDYNQLSSTRPAGVEAGTKTASNKHSSKPTNRYVTMCYIPTFGSKSDQSAATARQKTATTRHSISVHSKPLLGYSPLRPRSDSEPHYHGRDPRKRWIRINNNNNYDHNRNKIETNSNHSLRMGSHHQGFELEQSISNTYPHSIYKHTELYKQSGHSSGFHPRSTGSNKKTYTSQIDLFTHAHGVNSRGAPFSGNIENDGSLRRHSDEGILEGRNSTPLSLELVHAKTKPLGSQHLSSYFSSARPRTIKNTDLISHNSSASALQSDSQTEAGFQFSLIAGNISGIHSQHVSDRPIDSRIPPRSAFRQQRSCDILDDDQEDRDSLMTYSRMSDDIDAYSPTTENSSDFSIQSAPEGHIKTGILESRKLAKLINQPIHFMGARRRGQLYRPEQLYKDWNMLNKRKRLDEENRLVQAAVHKYKTELTVLEASLMVDCQAAYSHMTDPEKEELEELEWLWAEVRNQVVEMEHTLLARVRAVHAGNELYSLMSGLGVISRMIELIKEQICQQQMATTRTEEASMDEDIFGGDISYYHSGRHHSLQTSQSWLPSARSQMSTHQVRNYQSSSSSNLSHELNFSLEQIKSSVLSQVQGEIKENTKKLEQDLQEKDREIKMLQEQLLSRSISLPDPQPKRWTPRPSVSRLQRSQSRTRSPRVAKKSSQETDV